MKPELFAFGRGWGDELLAGLGVTLAMALLSSVLGSALGLAAAMAMRGPDTFARRLLRRCLATVRSLPEVLVIFMVYYGSSILIGRLLLPFGGTGFVNVDAFAAGLMSLSLIHGAYASEVFRGALANVPRGVMEAAAALGLPATVRFALVELPIAIRHAMPGLVNLVVVSLKVTPFLSIIGLQDLLRTATDAARNTKDYVSFYIAVLLIYLSLTSILYLVQMRVERRLESGAAR